MSAPHFSIGTGGVLPGALPLRDERVMVVDDNAGTATLIAGALQDAGATVEVTRSAESALTQAHRRRPVAMVIHLPLPKDGAAALCRKVRADTSLAGTSLVILSGEDAVDETSASVADVVQPRPFSPQHLIADVARLLRKD